MPTIMERLKEETRTAHEQLEALTLPLIEAAVDEVQYARLLRIFYGFFQPLEQRIHALVDDRLVPDIGERRQSTALLDDLRTIREEDQDLRQAPPMPFISTVAAAMGALYVLEGSTLGGRVISRMLTRQLDRQPEDGITFFNGYGKDTGEKWTTFTSSLNDYANRHPEETNTIVAAANETFTAFRHWIETNSDQ